jgi:integrase
MAGGVPGYSPHKVRHTGGTAKARNGAPGWVVQASLRHTRLSTTQMLHPPRCGGHRPPGGRLRGHIVAGHHLATAAPSDAEQGDSLKN